MTLRKIDGKSIKENSKIPPIKCITFYIIRIYHWEKTNIGCAIECGSRTFNSHMTPFGLKQTIYRYVLRSNNPTQTEFKLQYI